MSDTYTIRASSLPARADCSLREAAKAWPKLFKAASLPIKKIGHSIGSTMGTALHAGMASFYESGPDAAYQALEAALVPSPDVEQIYDATTPTHAHAQQQAREMLGIALNSELATLDVEITEHEYRVRIEADVELTGHPDIITTDGDIVDQKYGKLDRSYQTQLGAYSLLRRSHKGTVKALRVAHLARRKADPLPLQWRDYDRAAAEKSARREIDRAVRELSQFRDTGDPSVFVANAMSLLCTAKYCPLWGSTTCSAWIEKGKP